MKIIKVENCNSCPFKRDDNGSGFTEPFVMCDKFTICLSDFSENWNKSKMKTEIHPDCKLEDA